MRDRLARLHDPNDRSLGLEVAVGCHTFMSLLVFLFRLLGLYLVDLDAVLGIREVLVDSESIGIVHVTAFGVFAKDSVLGTCERLQRPLELSIVEVRGSLDFRIGDWVIRVSSVESQKDNSLKGADNDLFLAFGISGFQLTVSKSMLPSQPSAAVLVLVVCFEPCRRCLDAFRYLYGYIRI